VYNPQFSICCKTWYEYNLWCYRVFRWNPTWFSDWALKVLESAKMCKNQEQNGFGNLKTWTPTPHLETSPKKFKMSKPRLEVLLIIKELQTCHKGAEPFCGMFIRRHSKPFKLWVRFLGISQKKILSYLLVWTCHKRKSHYIIILSTFKKFNTGLCIIIYSTNTLF